MSRSVLFTSTRAIQDNRRQAQRKVAMGVLSTPWGFQALFSRTMQRIFSFLLSLFFSSIAQAACPDLTPYYPGEDPDWPDLSQQLEGLLSDCLESSEYFALYGAAQLNSGNIAEASESLERALLLQPDNGAAQIDYAEALLLQGQLFSALALNEQLLRRQDLPPQLQTLIEQRQENWQALTTERSFQLDLLAGYDNNLNGAPDPSQVTLTLAGEPILLDLNREFRPVSGPLLNFRLGGRYRQLAPEHQHNFSVDFRGRASEDEDSDLLQLDGRYAFIRPNRRHSWQLSSGVSHLQFGGSSLYTATDVGARYQGASDWRCKPYYSLTAQHQYFHGATRLNALESRGSVGMNCPLNGGSLGPQQLTAELSLLSNLATKTARPGGDRDGWQLILDWQLRLPKGEFRAQFNHTDLNDREGYSPLLLNGAERWLRRSFFLMQYRQPIRTDLTLLVNAYHLRQRSNLELFQSLDNTVEIGISLAF